MITHHPKHELLQAFVNGELPASLSIAVAAHIEMCPTCTGAVEKLTVQAAQQVFSLAQDDATLEDNTFLSMIDDITGDDSLASMSLVNAPLITFNGKETTLPRAFIQVPLKNWNKLGDVSRSRLDLNEEPLRSSLISISPQGDVPMHTHKGFELTLLLEGSFSDELGEYHAGDFIWLDNQHTHHPITENGCLCYTVSNDALHFTQGLNKLLNPFGSFLY